jgi:hypothetical protein
VVDLGALTAADFEPLVGERFDVVGAEPPVALELTEVAESARATDGRRGFSLLFAGPTDVRLEQGTWLLHVLGLGELAIFLVPVHAPEGVAAYEAVFT